MSSNKCMKFNILLLVIFLISAITSKAQTVKTFHIQRIITYNTDGPEIEERKNPDWGVRVYYSAQGVPYRIMSFSHGKDNNDHFLTYEGKEGGFDVYKVNGSSAIRWLFSKDTVQQLFFQMSLDGRSVSNRWSFMFVFGLD